jgi:hypothetical protein
MSNGVTLHDAKMWIIGFRRVVERIDEERISSSDAYEEGIFSRYKLLWSEWQKRNAPFEPGVFGSVEADELWRGLNADAEKLHAELQSFWPGEDIYAPSMSHIGFRLGRMISIRPNVKAAESPDDYAGSMIIYVAAEEPSAMALETACTEISLAPSKAASKSLPELADVLVIVRKHIELWEKRMGVVQAWRDGEIQRIGEEVVAARIAAALTYYNNIADRLEKFSVKFGNNISEVHAELVANLRDDTELSQREWEMVEFFCDSAERVVPGLEHNGYHKFAAKIRANLGCELTEKEDKRFCKFRDMHPDVMYDRAEDLIAEEQKKAAEVTAHRLRVQRDEEARRKWIHELSERDEEDEAEADSEPDDSMYDEDGMLKG